MTPQRDQLGASPKTRGRSLGDSTLRQNDGGRNRHDGGGNVHVGAVHISVSGAGDPKAVATEVNNQFRSKMMSRLHDIAPTAV